MKNLLLLPLEFARILFIFVLFGLIIHYAIILPLVSLFPAIAGTASIAILQFALTFATTFYWYRKKGQFRGWLRIVLIRPEKKRKAPPL